MNSAIKGLIIRIAGIVPDKVYLFFKAWYRSGLIPKIKNPETQDDKVRWLMLNYRDPIQTLVVDKVKVRKYVSDRIGKEYLKEIIGIYESVEEIDFESLPQQFVLKANHGSGWNIICKNKSDLDIEKTMKTLDGWMLTNYYDRTREWAYKDVEPKILCETYYADDDNRPLDEYTIFCNFGVPEYFIVVNRWEDSIRYCVVNTEWKRIDGEWKDTYKRFDCGKPKNLEKLLDIAKSLSEELPHCRIDLYNWRQKELFGEITLYPGGAQNDLMPRHIAVEYGQPIDIERIQREYMKEVY